MSLRLAFDLDGVLADLAARLEGPDGDRDTPTDTPSDRRRAWQLATKTENFWESLDEIEPGSVRRLSALARERRWEVVFLTSRPSTNGDAVQLQSQRWLARHGYELPAVFVTTESRGRVAAALAIDVVVDDSLQNCVDVAADSEARAVLVWRADRGTVPASARQLGIGSVASIDDVLQLLDEVDRTKRRGGGLLGLLKRRLGLG